MISQNRLNQTITFLRMAAAELRRLGMRAPTMTRELDVVASKLESEADDLAAVS